MTPESVLKQFINTIEATGGLVKFPNGDLAPCADHDWIDLADAYVAACEALGMNPIIGEDQTAGL